MLEIDVTRAEESVCDGVDYVVGLFENVDRRTFDDFGGIWGRVGVREGEEGEGEDCGEECRCELHFKRDLWRKFG